MSTETQAETETQARAPAPRTLAALLAIQSCSEFAAFGSGEVAARLLPGIAGADGWTEVAGEQIDELLDCGCIRLVGADEVWVTDAGLALLCDRGWFDREARRPTEQGRYWLARLVREDDRRNFKKLLSSYRASALASAVLGPVRVKARARP